MVHKLLAYGRGIGECPEGPSIRCCSLYLGFGYIVCFSCVMTQEAVELSEHLDPEQKGAISVDDICQSVLSMQKRKSGVLDLVVSRT